jgi:hypothetical protein
LGNTVPLVALQFREGSDRESCLISFARVALRFGECLMSQHGHDFIRAASGFGEPPPCGLAQPVRLTIERQRRFGDRVAHPLTETGDRVGLPVFSVDNGDVLALGAGK